MPAESMQWKQSYHHPPWNEKGQLKFPEMFGKLAKAKSEKMKAVAAEVTLIFHQQDSMEDFTS